MVIRAEPMVDGRVRIVSGPSTVAMYLSPEESRMLAGSLTQAAYRADEAAIHYARATSALTGGDE